MEFLIHYDTRLRKGFGDQVKYRLGREAEAEEDQPMLEFKMFHVWVFPSQQRDVFAKDRTHPEMLQTIKAAASTA